MFATEYWELHYTCAFVNLLSTLKSVKDSFKVFDYVTVNLAALFLVSSELDIERMKIQRLLPRPTTSKFQINIKGDFFVEHDQN